ncbi:unnamed protein product [Alopecurus aequalis]
MWSITFEKLELEVDEEDISPTEKMTKNDAQSLKLYCHTHNATGTGCERSTYPCSSRTLAVPHSSTPFRPLTGARYRLSDEEAEEYYNTKKRLTYGRTCQDGVEQMTEECLLAFRNYVHIIRLQDTEHRRSDIWTPKLYFAEVKQLSGVKYYFCFPLEASDNGHCYECKRQQVPDLKHPRIGGYGDGYSFNFDDCCMSDYSSDSDKDEDDFSSSVPEDHWLMFVN